VLREQRAPWVQQVLREQPDRKAPKETKVIEVMWDLREQPDRKVLKAQQDSTV
jgi:hypothetical protein